MSNVLLKNSVVEGILVTIINNNTYLKQVGTHYEDEIYADYRDELSGSQIEQISQSNDMYETFIDSFQEAEMNACDVEYDELIGTVKNSWDSDKYGDYDLYDDFISEWIRENVSFNFPFGHFLQQGMLVNIIVNTGDGNYDFTLNNFASYNASDEEIISPDSSILWLVKQQGYTENQLLDALNESNYQGSKFLKSVCQECREVTSHMNALAFFVKMSLGDFIEFSDNKKDLVLNSDSSCGLYDCWSGAGATLDIDLDKNVVIPSEYIEAHIDGTRGYGIIDIYGMGNDFWTNTIV